MTLGAIENLKSGNTTVCEIFFSSRYTDGADALAAEALDETGIRALLFRCSSDEEFAPGFIETTGEIDTRSKALLQNWRAHDRGRGWRRTAGALDRHRRVLGRYLCVA